MRRVRLDAVTILLFAVFAGSMLLGSIAVTQAKVQYEKIINDYQEIIATSNTTFDTILARFIACEKKYYKQQTIEPAGVPSEFTE